LRLPPNLGLLFFPPYTPELHPIERLWRDLKDWLAQYQPAALNQLSKLLGTRLKHYSAAILRSLTAFPYLLKTAQVVSGL
jgi:transposase